MPLLLVLLVVNLWTVLAFRSDKRAAIAGTRRTPEAHLLGLALIGGWPGALIARELFRHKTRKQPFATLLLLIAAVETGVLAGLFLL